MAILESRNLKKTYASNGAPTTVVSNLDLQVAEGEFAVVMGSSGSGKSTLLHMLSGLDQPTAGEIWLDGRPIHESSEKELALLRRGHVGFVFQQAHLVSNLTVWENIVVPGYLLRHNRKDVRQRAEVLLSQSGLESLCDRVPSQLSGGEQQRCAVVRALINKPRILMADEPTGSLNSSASTAVLDLFSAFHDNGQTILMVTHDVRSACRGDRVLYLRDGHLIDELIFGPEERLSERRERRLTDWLMVKGW